MRTHLYRCGAMRPWQRCRLVALPLALIALLISMPTTSAQASGVKAAVVQVPSGSLNGVLAGVPVSSLGLGNAEVGALLGELDGGVLGTQTAALTTLVGALLSGNPQATLAELTEEVQEDPVLGLLLGLAGKSITPETLLAALSPEQLTALLGSFTEGAGAAQVEQVLASLAAGEGVSGEEAAALQSILAGLAGSLSGEELGKLREDLAVLPTGLSAEELAALSPAQLAETVDKLFATATPTQLQPVVADLLGGVSWGAGTTDSLAQALGVPLETLAGALGESALGGFSTLPVVSGTVGSTGQVMGLVDRARGLAVGLLGREGEEGGSGGSGGSGGTGGGSGGSGGSGGTGGGSGGNGAGGGSGGSGAGGSQGAGSVPPGGLTLTITLPGTAPATPAAGARSAPARPPAKLRMLGWHRHGRVARIILEVPSAGTLKLSGRGVRSTSAHLSHGGKVSFTAAISQARMAALLRGHRHLKVRLTATFKPLSGAASRVVATIPFA
jgi:hypothetical protein